MDVARSSCHLFALAMTLLLALPAAQAGAQQQDAPEGAQGEVPASPEPPAAADPTPPAVPEGVEGPLFVVTTGDEAEATADATPSERDEALEIYAEGEDTFLTVFWWWVVGIAALAGLGALIWWIWGRRQPRRASRL